MSLRVLFRFRDLVAKTLEEHQKIIDARGYCWWGWWKRPSEDSRADVWSLLQAAIQQTGFETIGLFDSGSDKIWTAKVEGVVPPSDAAANSPPEIAAQERECVPLYYRESVFSRAWMKITKFEGPIHSFFDEYAYAEPPPLPKIPRKYLDKLRGKRISDAEELRAMDTTIWLIEPAKEGAGDDHFLLLTPSMREIDPISPEPIRLKSNKILHLSDLHYDIRPVNESQHSWSRAGRMSLHDMVSSSLGKGLSDVSLIIVSGDLTFRTKYEEFDQAFKGLNALLGVAGLGPENVIICPGNHDIAWSREEAETFDPKMEIEPDVAPEQACALYKAFYERLLQHPPNSDFSMGRRYVLPNGQVLEVCALNSNNLETGKRYLSGMGSIGPSAFEKVRSTLGWTKPSPALRMVVLHHHVVQTENVEQPEEYYRGFGLAVDAQRLLRDAGHAGVQLFIHGHRHRAFFWRSSVYELPEQADEEHSAGSISIIGAGSAGSTAVADESNFFTLIEIQPTCLSATMYKSQQGRKFRALKPWIAPFSIVDGSLVLRDWAPEHGA